MSALSSIYPVIQKPAAYWESQAKNAVVRGLIQAQKEDDERRRYYWRALHGFLQGVHREHLERRLAITHQGVARQWNKDESGHRYFPLIQRFAQSLAVVFWRPCETWLTVDGERLPESDPRVRQWRQDEEDCELDTVLQEVERQVIVLGQCLVSPSWVYDGERGRIKYNIHSPYELYLKQSPVDPSSFELAEQLSIELPQPSETLGEVGESLFLTWRRSDNRDKFGRIVSTSWENYLHDKGGHLRVNPLFPNNKNEYGCHPFVMWRGGARPAAGMAFIEPKIGWYHAQLNADIQGSDLDWICRFQAFSVAVATGGADLESFETGPDSLIKSQDSEFNFEYVTPDPRISELIEAFNFHLRTAAVAESLPPDTWEATSTVRNLAAKQLEQMALKLRRQQVVPGYLRELRKTFEVHKKVGDFWASQPGVDRVPYGEEVKIGIGLAPLLSAVDRFQDSSALQIEFQNGLSNPIDSIMSRLGLTRGEAEKVYERNKKYSEQIESSRLPAADSVAGEGIPRPASVEGGD